MTNLELCAVPYDTTGRAFYFSSYEEFEEKEENHPCEEFEIQFIEGSDEQLAFSKIVEPNQGNLSEWFEWLEQYEALGEFEQIGLAYLMDDCGYDFEDAIERANEVCIYEGSEEDYAYELVEDCYDLPEFAKTYFDYEKFGRDLRLGGDITEFTHNNIEYIITNPMEF